MPEQLKEQIEKRIFTVQIEVREGEDKKPKIRGHAAVFNVETVIGNWFREVIRPGFFKPAIDERHDVKAVIDHEGGLQTLGRTLPGTLILREDDKGLAIEVDPPDTTAGRDIVTLLKRGDLDQMSFMFTVGTEGYRWQDGEDGMLDIRELIKIKRLYDVAIVTHPQYTGTDVSARSAEAILREERPPRGFKPGPLLKLLDVIEAESA